MNFTAKQIAAILNGTIVGNELISVNKLSKIEEGKKGSISFLSNDKYTKYIYNTKASIVIVSDLFTPDYELDTTLVKVKDPYQAFTKLLEYYNKVKLNKIGKETPLFINETAKLGAGHYIGAFAYIGNNVVIGKNVKIFPHVCVGDNVTIKDNCVIYSGCKIYSETQIGNNCIIHAGAVIGSDGFGFAPMDDGTYKKIPQIGNVIIHDNVEIGASTSIDRATLGSTIINKGVKLDNLIQIAHNVVIGENTVIAAQTGIAGSAKIGKNCMIGGQVAIAGHIKLPDNTKLGAKTGIATNLKEEGLVLQGSPAMETRGFFRSSVIFRQLPDLRRQIDKLTKEIKQIKDEQAKNNK